jgi:hypothetical protein
LRLTFWHWSLGFVCHSELLSCDSLFRPTLGMESVHLTANSSTARLTWFSLADWASKPERHCLHVQSGGLTEVFARFLLWVTLHMAYPHLMAFGTLTGLTWFGFAKRTRNLKWHFIHALTLALYRSHVYACGPNCTFTPLSRWVFLFGEQNAG